MTMNPNPEFPMQNSTSAFEFHPTAAAMADKQPAANGTGQQFQCHGCHQSCHDSIFACWTCNFFLHDHCGNANRYVKHPSHALHPLVLLPTPTYCSGSFLCNGCGAPGSTFSYCCALCEVDLHVHCAYLPLKVIHKSHQHEVYISFRGIDQVKASPEYCKICTKELGSKNWIYIFSIHTHTHTYTHTPPKIESKKRKPKMEYKHFSHNHPLTLHKHQPGQQFHCHGCNLPCKDSTFACWSCNFFLHEHCGNANRYVTHPSHAHHPLVLVPSPTYCSGSFLCNACGAPGSSFSYCCALCEVDLHVYCAFLPPKLSCESHRHELNLSFGTPERMNSSDCCGVCGKEVRFRNWCYVCGELGCDFRVHTYCATSEVKLGVYRDDGVEGNVPGGGNHVRTEEMSPEEIVLEINRMRMEFEMAQALGNIIAYYPR
ncbi:hypothetical protein BUALT_Bualt12G0005200 [Buddleja alternifolia]|uniref:DC1 domain-containing protein n=1 Tax=Buddleja alternifolia TaxID=168488 RepID=A0AAV6WY41_9LAMI|nr:hypothetical protein BUALT_Bualt12G0005200 [Buddleja alternifolia]